MALFSELVKPALDSVTGLVQEFHLSPEDQQKAEQAIRDASQKAQASAREYDAQLNDIAGQNIRADAESGDKFTQRARPSFMYLILGILGFNYIALPFFKVFGSKVDPVTLPAELLTLFGVAITGYGFSRTAEKVAALPGDSQVSILGLKVGNKQ